MYWTVPPTSAEPYATFEKTLRNAASQPRFLCRKAHPHPGAADCDGCTNSGLGQPFRFVQALQKNPTLEIADDDHERGSEMAGLKLAVTSKSKFES